MNVQDHVNVTNFVTGRFGKWLSEAGVVLAKWDDSGKIHVTPNADTDRKRAICSAVVVGAKFYGVPVVPYSQEEFK